MLFVVSNHDAMVIGEDLDNRFELGWYGGCVSLQDQSERMDILVIHTEGSEKLSLVRFFFFSNTTSSLGIFKYFCKGSFSISADD